MFNPLPIVSVIDLGSDNASTLVYTLEVAGAEVDKATDRDSLMNAAGVIVTGDIDVVTAMARLREVSGDEIIERRLSGGRPVLGIGAGMQIMFDGVVQDGTAAVGLGQWPGIVRAINGAVVPESLAIEPGFNSSMFAGLAGKHFVFNNPLAVTEWTLEVYGAFQKPAVSYAVNGERFISAIENGPLSAVQFHPERSGDAGVQLLRNWLGTL